MKTIHQPDALTVWSEQQRAEGLRLGFVPTMGFLHQGHLSLMKLLRPQVDRLIVSIYVNPLQFGAGEDLEAYPADMEGDSRLCEQVGVDVLFAPQDLYPDGFCTSVSVHRLTEGLCGESRPGHFEGVATVVARLIGVTRCHVAAFGEKDYQQLCVLRQMARDLALPVEIVGGAIVRDDDGLALSSRNTYLNSEDRVRALSLSRALSGMKHALTTGAADVEQLLALGTQLLDVDKIDYLAIVDATTLQPVQRVTRSCRALVAAHVGETRLIDNLALEP
jgi:pantoate--beta-alanine ligase